MGKNSNIIEINGTKYDARTGAVIGVKAAPNHKPAGHSIKSAVKKPTMSDVVRKPARHTAARHQTPSQTLMRSAVKKPATAARKHSKAHGHMDVLATKTTAVVPKKSASNLDPKRLVQANRFKKSKLIQHFGPVTSDINQLPTNHQQLPMALISQPAPIPTKAALNSKPKTTAELLEHALKNASSHEQSAPVKKKTRKGLRITAGIAVCAALLGFAVVQQMPNIRMHMASSQAGFHASMPDYKPAGYSVGSLDTGSGVVVTTFNSNSDQRKYTLTQKTSNWDSQALRDNFVISHDKDYKIYTEAGRTIFVYGDHDATWVNAGIWYVVQSNGSLNDEQLVKLASSL